MADSSYVYLINPAFQFMNVSGKPLTDGYINLYISGTRSKYYAFSDFEGTLHPFNIPLNSLGSAVVLVSPAHSYDVYVYNSLGTLQLSRFNITPATGEGTVITDVTTLTSNDKTVDITANSSTEYNLSIATKINELKEYTDQAKNEAIESANTSIADLDNRKKDKQNELNFNGSATKTVKSITQNVNGELNVEFADIDLPSQVPNVEITSEDNSVKVTETTDTQTNTKTFDLSVNGGSGGTTYSAGDAIDLTNDTISVKYSKGLELNNNELQVKVESPLTVHNNAIGFIDAPIDNYSYVRNNGAWVPLPTSINDLIKRPSIISNDEEVYFVNHNSKYTYFKNAELSYPYYSINADIPCCIEMQSQNDLSKASNKIMIGLSEIELPKKLINFACSSDRLFALATNDTVSYTVYEVDIATLEIVNIYDLSEYGTVYNINYSNGKVLIIGYKDNVRSVVDLFNSEVLYQGNGVFTCAAIINDNLLVFFLNNFLNVNTGKITSFDDNGYVRFTVNDMYFSNMSKCYRITDEFKLEVVSDNVYGVTYSFARNELLYITSSNLVIIDSYGNRTSYFNSNSKVNNIFDMNSIIGAYGTVMFNAVS